MPLEWVSSLAIFEAVPIERVLALAAIYFAAFLVKGAIGIGSLTPTIVFGTLVVDAHHAVALALVANMLSQIQFVRPGLRDGDWLIARRIILPNFAFAAIGVWIFGRISNAELTFLLGLALGLLVLADLLGLWKRLARSVDVTAPAAVFILSSLSGLVSGVTGAGGLLFVAIYLRIIVPDKTRFRGTILLLSTLAVAWRATIMAVSGHIDAPVVAESLVLLPAIVLGGVAGTMVYGRISEARFGLVLQAVILFGSAILLWRGARQLLGI